MKWYRTGALAALAIAACAENPTQPGGTGPLSDQPLFGQIAGAGYTSVNEDEDGAGHCKNGNPNNNCNIYDGKEFVWLNGGPLSSDLGAGEYFFAVLEPSGQGGGDNPNDGTPHNLSDDFDDIANRTFTINSDGSISYGGTHDFDAPKIRLDPYATTSNPAMSQ